MFSKKRHVSTQHNKLASESTSKIIRAKATPARITIPKSKNTQNDVYKNSFVSQGVKRKLGGQTKTEEEVKRFKPTRGIKRNIRNDEILRPNVKIKKQKFERWK